MTLPIASPATPATAKITAVTRRDIFDYLRGTGAPWWGRLDDETAFLERLYRLDELPSTDSRFATARGDIVQHRFNNEDWDDDWIFMDARLGLRSGPDEVLLAFLVEALHPEVLSDVDQASRHVDQLNRLLEPDGWALRAYQFLSGRPVYSPVRVQAAGPLVSLPLNDDDAGKLDLVLGQVYSLLDCDGQEAARDLLRKATLTLRRDGSFYHPMPGDNWTASASEAVLTVDRPLLPAFTPAVADAIWQRLGPVLARLGRDDVQSLVVEGDVGPMPYIPHDWRGRAVTPASPVIRGAHISFASTDFDVVRQDFSDLEIRSAADGGFRYLYDTRANRPVTDFVLDDRPQVATLCNVTIIRKGDTYSPRIKLWKKDKSKAEKAAAMEVIPGTESTQLIKAVVDTSDAHENFWKVINFLQGCTGLHTPGSRTGLTVGDADELAEVLTGQDRTMLLQALKTAIGGSLTEEEIRLISNRKIQLQRFDRLLNDPEYFQKEKDRTAKSSEALWQEYFEGNSWIFGYGLNLLACEALDDGKLERITTGANIFTGAGKRIDAIMRSKGFISSMLFCEIKTHETPLLAKTLYRTPDVYQASTELGGGVAQVQKTVHKAQRLISKELTRLYQADGTPTGTELSTTKPRQVLVIGSLAEFKHDGEVNPEKLSSFELYRSSVQGIEVITFDELYDRACFIVADQ
ncbi:Shedu anti-phage system protein SduA domain-containing protein [Kitasatospora sp. NPDC001309]|uniref:Shedu anti-phage system protein SduA domain-containing protein n=1 Tax=Kitasatospora sp. NPDC001309 TaxID=3364013 RepID=UPI00367D9B1A